MQYGLGQASDERIKTNIKTIENALDKVLLLGGLDKVLLLNFWWWIKKYWISDFSTIINRMFLLVSILDPMDFILCIWMWKPSANINICTNAWKDNNMKLRIDFRTGAAAGFPIMNGTDFQVLLSSSESFR